MVQTGQVHRVQTCRVTKGLLRKHIFQDLGRRSSSSVGLWKMDTFWTGIFKWNTFWLEWGEEGHWLVAIPGGSAVCEMASRGKLGLFMGNARLGTRMRRERLPVTCMFWLDRRLEQSQWPNTKTRSKPRQWLGIRSPRSQWPILNIGILEFLVLWYWTSCAKMLIKYSFFISGKFLQLYFWTYFCVLSSFSINMESSFLLLTLLFIVCYYCSMNTMYSLNISEDINMCVWFFFKFSSPVESVSFLGSEAIIPIFYLRDVFLKCFVDLGLFLFKVRCYKADWNSLWSMAVCFSWDDVPRSLLTCFFVGSSCQIF